MLDGERVEGQSFSQLSEEEWDQFYYQTTPDDDQHPRYLRFVRQEQGTDSYVFEPEYNSAIDHVVILGSQEVEQLTVAGKVGEDIFSFL